MKSAGDTFYFLNPDGTKVLEAVRFKGQAAGVSGSGATTAGVA